MINLEKRSEEKELLDNPGIPFADLQRNMYELNQVNTYLGGHQVTILGLKRILDTRLPKRITICEIGCGGGDNLQALSKWCASHGVDCSFIGIDIKEECTRYAMEQYPNLAARWIVSDYRQVVLPEQPDIIFSSLFCHHFSNEELVSMLGWMRKNASLGFFINDLHRHVLAYHSIKMMTQLFSRSYLVKHDAPLSVARGFTRKEWQGLVKTAGIQRYSLSWEWAFRHLIVYRNE